MDRQKLIKTLTQAWEWCTKEDQYVQIAFWDNIYLETKKMKQKLCEDRQELAPIVQQEIYGYYYCNVPGDECMCCALKDKECKLKNNGYSDKGVYGYINHTEIYFETLEDFIDAYFKYQEQQKHI